MKNIITTTRIPTLIAALLLCLHFETAAAGDLTRAQQQRAKALEAEITELEALVGDMNELVQKHIRASLDSRNSQVAAQHWDQALAYARTIRYIKELIVLLKQEYKLLTGVDFDERKKEGEEDLIKSLEELLFPDDHYGNQGSHRD